MQLLAVGLNHREAPVQFRELVAFPPERLKPALGQLLDSGTAREASIISTCNRTELLVARERADHRPVLDWFLARADAQMTDLATRVHCYDGAPAARHLFRVASGLDSMVLGEPQVLGQVKQAFEAARDVGAVGKVLHRLYQQAFATAKRVRTDTAIGNHPVSVAYAATDLARQIFGSLEHSTALVVGAGDTAELIVRHLRSNGLGDLIVANRTLERAQRLAAAHGGKAIGLSSLPAHLPEADVLVTSTNAELPIIGKGLVERAIRARKRKPIFMLDLAVPRDIEPDVQALQDVYLYSVDDLEQIITENLKSREDAAAQAELIVDSGVRAFEDWWHSQQITPMLRGFRGRVERLKEQEVERALTELRRGRPAEAVVQRLANNLAGKLAHQPSVQLRRIGVEQDAEALRALRRLFDWESGDDDPV